MIEIYARETPPCSYCIAAVNLCVSRGLEYKKYVLDEDFWLDTFRLEFYNAKTFPQIKIDDKPIGGFHELQQALAVKSSLSGLSL